MIGKFDLVSVYHCMSYRDLRAANCLVGDEYLVQVSDFWLSRIDNDVYIPKEGEIFAIKWTAPEGLLGKHFSMKSDIWGKSCYNLLWVGGRRKRGRYVYTKFMARN